MTITREFRALTIGLVLLVVAGVLAGCDGLREHTSGSGTPASGSGTPASGSGSGSAGSGGPSGAAVPVGSSTRTIVVDSLTRTYHLYRPATLTVPAPLVIMLHGGFGTGAQAEKSYGWDAEADRDHFLVAYPDGQNHAWNVGGGCCGQPGASNVDDVGFITRMVAALQGTVPLDTARLYATGISNGGLMSYRLACDTSIFAAIGPDSATLLGSCPSPHPLSVIHIHGRADTKIPYDGGKGQGVEHIDGPSVPSVIAQWRATDRCMPPTSTTAATVTTSIADCPDGMAVELITIAGAGHQWPGAAPDSKIQKVLGADPPSTALNATDTIWAFFAAHPK